MLKKYRKFPDKLPVLQNDLDTGRIFSQPLFISFKRDKNIVILLVRSALQTSDQPGTFKCARAGCKKNWHVLSFAMHSRPQSPRPFWLAAESRALGATISGMRHRCRLRSETGWAEFGYFLCYFKMAAPRALVFRPGAGQGERRLWERDWIWPGSCNNVAPSMRTSTS